MLHPNPHYMNVAAQNIIQGQDAAPLQWIPRTEFVWVLLLFISQDGFSLEFTSLGSVPVTCLRTDVGITVGSCNGHVWKCLAVSGTGEWFWRSLNLDCLLDSCFKGRFILYGVCFKVFGLCDLSAGLYV